MTPAAAPLDEMVDGAGRLRPHWRGVLAGFADHEGGGMAGAAHRIARVFEEEGITSLLPGEVPSLGQASWRCDPVPMVLPDEEFALLAAGLAQRARLLEALLADLYGPQALLADGTIPPELVLANPAFLRPCRDAGATRHPFLHCYAADLLRAPDGRWHVVADRTSRAGGIGHALENRRIMARALPAVLRGHPVRPLRPFFELWQDALARLAPPRAAPGQDSPRVALLTPGVHHKLWFEHVLLARELSCALVEPGDLAVRGGAVFLKTLQGLQPLDVLLRRVPGRGLDPLEFDGAVAGVPGLLDAARQGAVKIANEPGAGLVEGAGIAALLPALAPRLLGEPLLLPQPETLWLADPAAMAAVRRDPAGWALRPARGGSGASAPMPPDPAARGRDWVASRVLAPSVVPCVQQGGLVPLPLRLRLFLVQDGARWHALPGGLARVQGASGLLAKDVWVLNREEAHTAGAAAQPQPPMAIRRAVGELPSRVADNLFWLGRYVERLEGGARLQRATLTRLDRGTMLPREQAELSALFLCLRDAGLAEPEDQPTAGTTGPLREALLRGIQPGGAIAELLAQVARLVEAVRDRLTADMYATFTLPLRALRIAAQQSGGLAGLEALLGQVLRYTASVAGVAAENMVRAGGYTFLDLGRRVERAQSIAAQLRFSLAQPPARLEGGLKLALELCDSVITYRSRYLGVLQPAPALDLVLADPGNPRGLGFQLHAIRRLLAELPGGGADLAQVAALLVAEVEALPALVQASPAQDAATTALPPVLARIEAEVAQLSDAVTRRYFALLPALQAVGGAPAGAPPLLAGAA
ncbi:circularly permuted type 2 ATP-grasp protein [Roseomonas haemaphysalidis]|uniref:Circularly permuted type 2 ATP-grasp protein n=1 Tax=Roseomonas haemaphysalidis TaxID=2768162 RepID=A0ABS3KL13_9PROT|nr:circularly permuted type 2 ATP-grasp protein [Roseomonas haemaphysalidis]MBO1078131.1 circularly permuted type 2 ATP-grasp protein [Roseomonas haemaphysalidis]